MGSRKMAGQGGRVEQGNTNDCGERGRTFTRTHAVTAPALLEIYVSLGIQYRRALIELIKRRKAYFTFFA